MELIKISYEKRNYGFGKPEKVEHKAVKFDCGKVAYVDAKGVVQVHSNVATLKNEIRGAVIEIIEE